MGESERWTGVLAVRGAGMLGLEGSHGQGRDALLSRNHSFYMSSFVLNTDDNTLAAAHLIWLDKYTVSRGSWRSKGRGAESLTASCVRSGRLSFVQESRRHDRHAFPYHDTAQVVPANHSISAVVHLMALSRRKKFCSVLQSTPRRNGG